MILQLFCSVASLILFFNSMFKIPETSKDASTIPLGDPKFKKLIYLLVDGLRFDAFVPVNKQGFYYNNFTFTKDPEKLKTSFLSVSGIPTATTCRVIGMMTGTPSNQIEEILTFFISSVSVESFPDKFQDRKMKFYGDDLWEHCFKGLGGKCCTIKGLSKRNMAQKEIDLIEKIKKDKESEIKFIHIISLDSFGHTYGTEHAIIKECLLRADRLINDLYDDMDDETLLVVTSDHGVTNEGAHGGNSKFELSSTCGFYSKKMKISLNNEIMSYNTDFLSKFYNFSDANTKDDFIAATTPYRVIHQDDILPTVAYFMGVPTPMNTYGNLIPYIVKDDSAQKILLNQKKSILTKPFLSKIVDSIAENYAITELIYKISCSKRPIIAILSAMFGLTSIIKTFLESSFLKDLKGSLVYIVAVIFASHSFYSFASEDLIWSFAFLITNFSLSNLIFIVFFIRSPGRSFFENEKIKFMGIGAKIDLFCTGNIKTVFNLSFVPILLVLFFTISKIITRKGFDFTIFKKILKIAPQLSFIFYNYYLEATFDNKIDFLALYPSLDSLMTVHFNPFIAIIFIFLIKNLDLNSKQSTKSIVLELIPYLLGLEKVLQSIDYDVFMAYSYDFGSLSNFTGALAYTIIPRLYIHSKFKVDNFLITFSLLACFACSWVMHGSLVFSYFFVGRLLFVSGFFIADLICENLILMTRTKKVKMLKNK